MSTPRRTDMRAKLQILFLSLAVLGDFMQPLSARDINVDVDCDKFIDPNTSAHAIVASVFFDKINRLVTHNLVSEERAATIKEASFVICQNELRGYDTYVIHSTPPMVVFEIETIGFLFAQARSLILGQYIANARPTAEPFDLHKAVMREFANQSNALKGELFEFIDMEAQRMGVTADFVSSTQHDANYQRQEQTLILQSLYFLVLHEFCHVWLDHGQKLSAAPTAQRDQMRPKHEFEADACAIDVINRDERQYSASPVAFFGTLLTVSTQLVVDTVLSGLSSDETTATPTHPASQERLKEAGRLMRSYIRQFLSDKTDTYLATTDGALTYFLSLADEFDSM